MTNATYETEKRLKIANELISVYEPVAKSIILTGSVAYSPNQAVTQKSDLDLIVIAKNLRKNIDNFNLDKKELANLKSRFFEGYCLNSLVENVLVSTHFLSEDALDIISKVFVGDIRVYRHDSKPGNYILRNFEGRTYNYYIKNIVLDDLKGVRTIVPVSFINNDSYFIGVHRDKLLSNPLFLYSPDNYSEKHIEKMWYTVAQNLVDESRRRLGLIDLERMNVLNALAKADKMIDSVKDSIKEKAKFYVGKVR